MFFMNECVQSCRHGMGIVVRGGHDPVVQFLDGPRLRVMGGTLRIIPDQVYDAEVLNRAHIERWLEWRIHAVVRPAARLLARGTVDLADGIKETVDGIAVLVADDDATGALWFTAEEVNRPPDEHDDGCIANALAYMAERGGA